jgi:hypothetical protein
MEKFKPSARGLFRGGSNFCAKAAWSAVIAAMFGINALAVGKGGQDEKTKALANPYANDLGQETLNVSSYPKDIQKGYTLLMIKCAQCHTAARPLHSQFVEPLGDNPGAQEAAILALKKEKPELFNDQRLWHIEAGIWKRYVKRMMSKPGCEIQSAEGKKIYEFLVYDSNQRKLKDPKAWTEARRRLLEDFRKKAPGRYKELYEE